MGMWLRGVAGRLASADAKVERGGRTAHALCPEWLGEVWPVLEVTSVPKGVLSGLGRSEALDLRRMFWAGLGVTRNVAGKFCKGRSERAGEFPGTWPVLPTGANARSERLCTCAR
eukprot:14920763-Alexandrium_andersonii.AAC.1